MYERCGVKLGKLNIYLVYRNESCDWDEYQGFVVVSESEEKALMTHPSDNSHWDEDFASWVKLSEVDDLLSCDYIGEASDEYSEGTIICTDFNAG